MRFVEQLGRRHWTDYALIVASIQWVIFMFLALLSRRTDASGWLRAIDRYVIGSTLVVFMAWYASFRHLTPPASKPAQTASVASRATCASIAPGMTADEVRAKLGKPDDVTSAENLRGPGAERWNYTATECRVHIVDERVTFVD